MNSIKAIGVMSGTSLDGIDLVACEFIKVGQTWRYSTIAGTTVNYTPQMYQRLLTSHTLCGRDLALLHSDYGTYIGNLVRNFVQSINFQPDIVASHGYTVFHEPQVGMTLQIGSGAHIAAACGINCVCDFRTTDVALGGNGAPLVPIGDLLLFGNYAGCLNIGGFANLSFTNNNQRIAYDICPANFVFNFLARKMDLEYDVSGNAGRKGQCDNQLLNLLNNNSYYSSPAPKSLGREFVEQQVLPLFGNRTDYQNLLCTYYHHAAQQIASNIDLANGQVLVTGGGAYNSFLMELIAQNCKTSTPIIGEKTEVELKEAIIFAFLGALRISNETNCLKSVTGAKYDNIGGCIYLGNTL